MQNKRLSFPILALLGSSSTLLCCVVPALLVSLGFGSVVASFIGTVPQVTWLSENKGLVFALSGFLIALSGFWEWKRRNDPCPLDPQLARACTKLRKISVGLWALSAIIFTVSLIFVFVVPKFLNS